MKKSLKILFIASFSFIYSSNIFAQTFMGSRSATSTGDLFFFNAGAGASYGKIEGEKVGLASRSMIVYGLNTDLGIRLKGFKMGLGLDYGLWKQLEEPSKLNGTNAQGKELSWGPTLGYDFGFFNIMGRYFLSSKYEFEKADSSGEEVNFSKPKSSFAVDIKIPSSGGVMYYGLGFKKMKYSKTQAGSSTKDLDAGSELLASSYGVSVGFGF